MVPIKRHTEDIPELEEKRGTPKRFEIMVEQTQLGYMPTSTDDNQLDTGTNRVSREGQFLSHINATIKKTEIRVPV